jgi:LuxR family transcriptional regulator, maltose regulon positive regulatory protein
MYCAVAQPGTATSEADSGSGQRVVERRALYETLSVAHRVTQVSAPAGAGKSVLLRSWIVATGLDERTAWVSVERQERDPQRFWLSVLSAVRGTDSGSELVRAVTGAPGLDGWSIVERLIEDLSGLEDRLWLVVDDLHELEAGDALEQLELLLMRAPAHLRFVLSGRRDVRLGLHRLRLQGELTEIRGEDLRFTLEDSRALFEEAGVQLSDGALESLVVRTEGWAAGLRLAALSLAADRDPEWFAADFSGTERTVAEYLVAEVLDRQPEDITRLLLRTSILEKVTGPLADRLSGTTGSERILAELERAGAFVVALDPQGTSFRYHRLFADLLALELRRTAPDDLPRLHTIASEWFAEHGQPVQAIRHAQAAEDWSLAAGLLSDHWFGMYLDGEWATAHELLTAFPHRTVAEDAELASIAAADQVTGGSLEEGERYLALAMRGFSSVPEPLVGRCRVRIASLRLRLAQARNDVATTDREAKQLLALVQSENMPPGVGEDVAQPRQGRDLDRGARGCRALPRASARAGTTYQPSVHRARRAGASGATRRVPIDTARGGAKPASSRARSGQRLGQRQLHRCGTDGARHADALAWTAVGGGAVDRTRRARPASGHRARDRADAPNQSSAARARPRA